MRSSTPERALRKRTIVLSRITFSRADRSSGKAETPRHFHSAVASVITFSLRNGNPLNLENVLRDPRLQQREFRADSRRLSLHAGHDWLTAAKKRLH